MASLLLKRFVACLHPPTTLLAAKKATEPAMSISQVTQADIAAVKRSQEAELQAQREAAALEKKRITVQGELGANPNAVRCHAHAVT